MNKDETDIKLQKLFATMSKNFFTHAFESILDSKKQRSGNLAMFLGGALIILIIIISGVEPVKLFFRKRFGSQGINTSRLTLSIVSFVVMAIVSYVFFLNYSPQDSELGTKESFLHAAIIHVAIAIFLLVKSHKEKTSKNDTYQAIYRGDSVVFDFLISSGLNQNVVQNVVEPIFLLIVGGALLTYNQFLAWPLITCSISFWLFLLAETLLGLGYARSVLANKGHAYSQNRKFLKAQ